MTWSAYVSDSDVWLGTRLIFPSCKHLIMCLGCTSLLRFRVWAASIKGTWIWYDGSWCFFYAFPRYWTNALLTDYLYNCGLRILFRGVVNAESFMKIKLELVSSFFDVYFICRGSLLFQIRAAIKGFYCYAHCFLCLLPWSVRYRLLIVTDTGHSGKYVGLCFGVGRSIFHCSSA